MSADYTIIANLHIRQDNRVLSNEYIIAYLDRTENVNLGMLIPENPNAAIVSYKGNTSGERHVVTDCDQVRFSAESLFVNP